MSKGLDDMSHERRPSCWARHQWDLLANPRAGPRDDLVCRVVRRLGLVGGLASVFSGLYHLTASQTALLVAVPVLLGSLARLPMGILTDRFGGRVVFTGSSPSRHWPPLSCR
jgi:hypothetical protein